MKYKVSNLQSRGKKSIKKKNKNLKKTNKKYGKKPLKKMRKKNKTRKQKGGLGDLGGFFISNPPQDVDQTRKAKLYEKIYFYLYTIEPLEDLPDIDIEKEVENIKAPRLALMLAELKWNFRPRPFNKNGKVGVLPSQSFSVQRPRLENLKPLVVDYPDLARLVEEYDLKKEELDNHNGNIDKYFHEKIKNKWMLSSVSPTHISDQNFRRDHNLDDHAVAKDWLLEIENRAQLITDLAWKRVIGLSWDIITDKFIPKLKSHKELKEEVESMKNLIISDTSISDNHLRESGSFQTIYDYGIMASERNALQNYIDIMTENEFKQWWPLQRTKWSRDRSLSLERKSKSRTLKNKGELVMKEAAAAEGVSLRIINRAIESISRKQMFPNKNKAAKKIHKKIDEFEEELLERSTRDRNFFRWTGFMNMKVGGEDDEYGRWRRNDGGRYFYKSEVRRAGVFNGNVTIKSFGYIPPKKKAKKLKDNKALASATNTIPPKATKVPITEVPITVAALNHTHNPYTDDFQPAVVAEAEPIFQPAIVAEAEPVNLTNFK